MIAALCFGSIFGFPFIIWGVILVADRDRSWQRQLQRGHSDTLPRRTRAWDRRQIAYGALLMLFGATILILLTAFNFLAQGISPAAPF